MFIFAKLFELTKNYKAFHLITNGFNRQKKLRLCQCIIWVLTRAVIQKHVYSKLEFYENFSI